MERVFTGILELLTLKMVELTMVNGLLFRRRRSNGLALELSNSQMAQNIKDKPRKVSSTARVE